MIKRSLMILTTTVIVLGAFAQAHGDDLWKDDTGSIYTDVKAKQFAEHDLVTIVVQDTNVGTTKANTNTEKKTDWQAAINEWMSLHKKAGQLLPTLGRDVGIDAAQPSIDVETKLKHDGTGQTQRQGKMTFTITAEVVQVMPNGTLVLEATKTIQINEEQETLTITGIVRPDDIGTDNTVKSDKIARGSYKYTGKEGPVTDSQDRSFLQKILDAIWPF
jgi:flagellar L-ring protein precursor FlgH